MKKNTQKLILTGMFTAILCVLSQITIPIQPIPFSLSLLAVFLTGALLPPRHALLSTLAYLLLGAFGLPVFAGFKGGVYILAGMTGGFLMAYPVMAFVTSLAYHLAGRKKPLALSMGMLVSLCLCYLIGAAWFAYLSGTGFSYALTVCVYPFVLFDLIKILLAVSASSMIRKILDRME